MIQSVIGIIIGIATMNAIGVGLTTKRAARWWDACRHAIITRFRSPRGRDWPATWSEPPIVATWYAGRTWYAPPF